MRSTFATIILACGQAVTPAFAAEPLITTPLPIEAVAEYPAMSGATLSPDGKHVAALVAQPGQKWPVVSVWEADDLSRPPVTTGSPEMRPRAVHFLGNERIIILLDRPLTYGALKTFTVQAIVTDVKGGKAEKPFATKGTMSDTAKAVEAFGVNFAIVQAGSLQNPDRYLIARQNVTQGTVEILSVDTKTMAIERVARTGDNEAFILADIRDGELMVKESLRSTGDGWKVAREIRNRTSGAWEEHPELGYLVKDRYTIDPQGFFDQDPNKLYVSTNRHSNFQQIRVYDIVARTWESEPAFAAPDYDISSVAAAVDFETKTLKGPGSFTLEGPARRTQFVEPAWEAIQKGLEGRLRGLNVDVTDVEAKSKRAIVTVSAPAQPPVYFLLKNGTELQQIGKSRPSMNAATFGQTKLVTYKARDGLSIPALLTVPKGYDKTRHGPIPLVVNPHGGPWVRDYIGWDASGWTQFLTTRGYAVLQPQYRGSKGWGMALWKAGDKEWGQKMQDDKDDGAAWLVAEGIADPKRMAIFGYSYGGFAAVAASVRPNSPYQCAIAGAPVADLQRLGNLWGANAIAREAQGWTVAGMNPIANVDKANIPILLYHGDRDRQADTVHSELFYSAMKSAGKDVEFHLIKDMWHQLPWWPEWHRETLGYIDAYLQSPKCFGNKITVTAPNK
ncbi:MAG: prolyl oligopeptidase family serine peptidase [Alphaproteobacteria bacterium]|nr:prolyl oligopeptidase family serine peptidase [Alphaproteobacteria bacterium]